MVTRHTARVYHDEVRRLIQAAKSCGLAVKGVSFDGNIVQVITGESGDISLPRIDAAPDDDKPIREPKA